MARISKKSRVSAKPLVKEIRIRDPKTGGEKGSKLACFSHMPAGALHELAEHYGKGARKYSAHNFRKGYKWSLSFDAMMRHAWAWQGGEDIDEETGSNHMTAVAWHALALLSFIQEHPEMDDRPHTTIECLKKKK